MADLPRPALQLVEPDRPLPPLRDPKEPGIFDPVARELFERGPYNHRDIVVGASGRPAVVREVTPA